MIHSSLCNSNSCSYLNNIYGSHSNPPYIMTIVNPKIHMVINENIHKRKIRILKILHGNYSFYHNNEKTISKIRLSR